LLQIKDITLSFIPPQLTQTLRSEGNQIQTGYLLSLRCLKQLSYSCKGIRTGQLWHSRYWVSSNLRGLRSNLCWRWRWTWEFHRNWESTTLLQNIRLTL